MLEEHVRVLSCTYMDRSLRPLNRFVDVAVKELSLAEGVEEERLERLRIEKRHSVLLELLDLAAHWNWWQEAGEEVGEESIVPAVLEQILEAVEVL